MPGADGRLLLFTHRHHFLSGCCIWATIEPKALFRPVSAILAVLAVLYRPGEETIQRPVPGPQRPIPGPMPIPATIRPDPTDPTAPTRPDPTRPRTRHDRTRQKKRAAQSGPFPDYVGPTRRRGPCFAAPAPSQPPCPDAPQRARGYPATGPGERWACPRRYRVALTKP
jgi:hypothetical protein